MYLRNHCGTNLISPSMRPNISHKARFTKEDLLMADLELPPRECAPDAIRFGLFDWLLYPHVPDTPRMFKVSCTGCVKVYKMKWPFNTTTLKSHIHGHHYNTIIMLQNQVLASGLSTLDSILESSLAIPGGSSTTTLDNLPGIHNSTPSENTALVVSNSRSRNHPEVELDEYSTRLMELITANSLPLVSIDSPVFKAFVRCLKEDLPDSVTSEKVEDTLQALANEEVKRFKERISKNNSKFALTIKECKSFSENDFLAVTLHFLNDSFELETLNIGFEHLNASTSYTGRTIFEFLHQVITGHDLTNKISSITRDITKPMDECMTEFDESSLRTIKSPKDIRCLESILNLAIDEILNYTFFRTNKTTQFKKSLKELPLLHPCFQSFQLSVMCLPETMRSIIREIRHNDFLKNLFNTLVEKRLNNHISTESFVQEDETLWFSTFEMIDHFLYFKDEIQELLIVAGDNFQNEDFDLESYEISDFEWEHLSGLKEVLDIFRGPMLKLQKSSFFTVNRTLPFVMKILKDMEHLQTSNPDNMNPFLYLGISKIIEKILEYYPMRIDNIERLKDLYIATVLDPRYKLEFFENIGFSKYRIKEIRYYFLEVFDRYSKELDKEEEIEIVGVSLRKKTTECIEIYSLDDTEDDYFLVDDDKNNEAEIYLRKGRERCNNPMEYYRDQKSKYPVLSRMARDYLAISASSKPANSLSLHVEDILSQNPSVIPPPIVKIMAILRAHGKIPNDSNLVDENMKLTSDSGGERND